MHFPRGPLYDTRVFDSPSSWKTVAEPWEELGKAQDRPPQLRQHPAWLELELLGHPNREARVVALYERGALVGVVPVLLRNWGWPLRIGPRPVARLPVRLAQVIGEGLLAPPAASALETLLERVSAAARPSDVLLLEGIPVESPRRRIRSGVVREQPRPFPADAGPQGPLRARQAGRDRLRVR